MMNYQLVISDLSWNTSENKIMDFFSTIGKVEAVKLLTNSISGDSLGKAFVSFRDDADVLKAKNLLKDELLDGQKLRISKISDKEKRFKRAFFSQS